MKCTVCRKEMKKVFEGATYNPSHNDKEYKKELYVCRDDDVWISIETPVEIVKPIA